jgi:hypothetical protein
MHEWRLRRATPQHWEVAVNGSNGPFVSLEISGVSGSAKLPQKRSFLALEESFTNGRFGTLMLAQHSTVSVLPKFVLLAASAALG